MLHLSREKTLMTRKAGIGRTRVVDEVETVRRVCRHIQANLEGSLTLADLGNHAGISPAHLQRVFKRVTGITPRQYADACRLGRLKPRPTKTRTATLALNEAG